MTAKNTTFSRCHPLALLFAEGLLLNSILCAQSGGRFTLCPEATAAQVAVSDATVSANGQLVLQGLGFSNLMTVVLNDGLSGTGMTILDKSNTELRAGALAPLQLVPGKSYALRTTDDLGAQATPAFRLRTGMGPVDPRRLEPVANVNVASFGVNGNDTLDDRGALQLAIDTYAQANNGGVLYLPAGTYYIDAPSRTTDPSAGLVFNGKWGFTLAGAGRGQTIIKARGSVPYVAKFEGLAFLNIEGITFDGGNATTEAVVKFVDGMTRVRVKSVDITHGGTGITNSLLLLNAETRSITNQGVTYHGPGEISMMRFEDVRVEQEGGPTPWDAVRVTGSQSFMLDFVDSKIAGARYLVETVGGSSASFFRTQFELPQDGVDIFHLNGGTQPFTVEDCWSGGEILAQEFVAQQRVAATEDSEGSIVFRRNRFGKMNAALNFTQPVVLEGNVLGNSVHLYPSSDTNHPSWGRQRVVARDNIFAMPMPGEAPPFPHFVWHGTTNASQLVESGSTERLYQRPARSYVPITLSQGGVPINVKDGEGGARGDGKADDTDSIVKAINRLNGGPGTIYFPPGDYRVRGLRLEGLSGVRFMGAGISHDLPLPEHLGPGNVPIHGTIIRLTGAETSSLLELKNTRFLDFETMAFEGSGLARDAVVTIRGENSGIGFHGVEIRHSYEDLSALGLHNLVRIDGYDANPGEYRPVEYVLFDSVEMLTDFNRSLDVRRGVAVEIDAPHSRGIEFRNSVITGGYANVSLGAFSSASFYSAQFFEAWKVLLNLSGPVDGLTLQNSYTEGYTNLVSYGLPFLLMGPPTSSTAAAITLRDNTINSDQPLVLNLGQPVTLENNFFGGSVRLEPPDGSNYGRQRVTSRSNTFGVGKGFVGQLNWLEDLDRLRDPAGEPQASVVSADSRMVISITIGSVPKGVMRLKAVGVPGGLYRIQASGDLRAWADLGSTTARADGAIAFDDPKAPEFAKRFYRFLAP